MTSDVSPNSRESIPGGLFPAIRLGGLPIAVTDSLKAASSICSAAKRLSGTGIAIHLVNAYTVALANRDPEYADLLNRSTANLPDGKPLTWVSRAGGKRLWQVRGPSLFENVFDLGRTSGVRHFLLGTTDETLSQLTSQLNLRFPGANVVGAYSPPFRDMTESEIKAQDRMILESHADIVWVGLGTPKQDFEVQRIAARLPVVAVAVGAAFDFVAGTKKEAPPWMTKVGLEWFYRLCSEPRRLWKRYLIGNFEFLWAVAAGK